MKKNPVLIASVVLVLPFQVMAADTASWANWTSETTGSFMQASSTIHVTYTGAPFAGHHGDAVDYGDHIYNIPSSFTSAEVTNTPGSNGTLLMTGGTSEVNNFHFSAPVIDPIMTVFSVGQLNTPVTFNFLNGATFSILSQGPGFWGGGSLTQNGSSITGLEGNGLLRFHGTYTDIYFTTPDHEFFYGGTIGAVAAIPEPATYAMFLTGVGLLGWIESNRRKLI